MHAVNPLTTPTRNLCRTKQNLRRGVLNAPTYQHPSPTSQQEA
jgi:hypothetical protein